MTKYVTTGNTRCRTVYHVDPNCKRIKKDVRETTDREIKWHDLDVCSWCDPEKVSHLE